MVNNYKHVTKQQFGRRLYQLMTGKGWNQSELARRADIQRDSVSTYVTGRSLPTQKNLEKLAKALDVKAEDLLPNVIESALDQEIPAFDMRQSRENPSQSWVRVNRLVSFDTAIKIAALINEDSTTPNGR